MIRTKTKQDQAGPIAPAAPPEGEIEMRRRGKDAFMSSDMPICQFGPGGDFARPWPKGCKAIEVAAETDPVKLARDAGLEPPVVSIGPEGIAWCKPGLCVQKISDDEAVTAAEKAAILATASAPASSVSVGKPRTLAARLIFRGASALAELLKPQGGGEAMDEGCYTAEGILESDYEYRADRYAKATGDTPVDSGLSQPTRLFPDVAGDRRPVGVDEGYRLRTRRSARRKGPYSARVQAQGPLFAGGF